MNNFRHHFNSFSLKFGIYNIFKYFCKIKLKRLLL